MTLADGLPILLVSLLLLLHLTHNVLAIDERLKTTHWIKMKKENPCPLLMASRYSLWAFFFTALYLTQRRVNHILSYMRLCNPCQPLNLIVLVISTTHCAEKKLCTSKKGGMVGDELSHLQRETTWQLLCLAREGLSQLQRQAISLLLCENTFSPYSHSWNHVMLHTTGKNCTIVIASTALMGCWSLEVTPKNWLRWYKNWTVGSDSLQLCVCSLMTCSCKSGCDMLCVIETPVTIATVSILNH